MSAKPRIALLSILTALATFVAACELAPPIPPENLQSASMDDPKNTALLLPAMAQITQSTSPSLKDWQNLVAAKPAGITFQNLCPVGPKRWPMTTCTDHQGNIWIGCESDGLFRFSPAKPADQQWIHFRAPAIGDDSVYALACDLQGRIWAGTLKHGVAVWNGQGWRQFESVGGLSRPGTQSGPLGERIFHIAICPPTVKGSFHDLLTGKDSPAAGSVWMITNIGISIWFPSTDTWSCITTADGFPSSQSNSLDFGPDGTLYVATAAEGVAISDLQSNYTRWKLVRGTVTTPAAANGPGLPSPLINDILVARDNTVYAATTAGIAWSIDRGNSWEFTHGADWIAKVKGQPKGPPANWTPAGDARLSEDYSTALAEDAQGRIHVGHRSTTADILLPRATRRVGETDAQFVTCLSKDASVRCTYGNGVLCDLPSAAAPPLPLSAPAKMPSAAAAPSDDFWLACAARLADLPSDAAPNTAFTLPQDWQTQGTWVGRKGKYWACLCGDAQPDLLWNPGPTHIRFNVRVGDSTPRVGGVASYVNDNYTTDIRSLEMPPMYLDSRVVKKLTARDVTRRQAQWNDSGQTLAPAIGGPNLYVTLTIPPGNFYLSLYNINYEAHAPSGNNARRDFPIAVRTHQAGQPLNDILDFSNQTLCATGRASNFYAGVWNSFLVRGPAELTVQFDRNASLNTILSGIMLDLVDEDAPPYGIPAEDWQQRWDGKTLRPLRSKTPADKCFAQLENLLSRNPGEWSKISPRLYPLLLRAWSAQAADPATPKDLLLNIATCAFRCNDFELWEQIKRKTGAIIPRDIENSLRWDGKTDSYTNAEYRLIRDTITKTLQPNDTPK